MEDQSQASEQCFPKMTQQQGTISSRPLNGIRKFFKTKSVNLKIKYCRQI